MPIRLIATSLFCIFSNIIVAQHYESLSYCQCTDSYGSITSVRDGKYARVCKGKVIETGQFINGRKDGEWVSYSTKGQLIRQFHYQNGHLHGRVNLYYSDGTKKLNAYFTNGLPDSTWHYFTSKGNLWIDGTYKAGAPIGKWTVRDKKGNSPVCIYNYDTQQYLEDGDATFLKKNGIVQNDNTHEYFILHYPLRPSQGLASPLGGFEFASDIFVHVMEIPVDYWNTYANLKYRLQVELSDNHTATYTITSIDNHMDDGIPVLPFIVNTNRPGKLQHIDHSSASKFLLDLKIREAVSLLPPWTNKRPVTTELYVPYVINEIFK